MNRSGTSTLLRRTGVVAACTAIVGLATATGPSALAGTPTHAGDRHDGAQRVKGRTLTFQSPLSDLQPTTAQPLDGARGTLRMTIGARRTGVVLTVRGIARSATGTTFGAHLHSGPCVPGDGVAAGPHYNSAAPPVVDADHEVWLDFTVTSVGSGRATTVVPFVPVHGARSVVVHEMATNHDTGAAGARLACFPVVW
ncbi:MAG: superoxide dismutase family protein [Pedococcus sp.]